MIESARRFSEQAPSLAERASSWLKAVDWEAVGWWSVVGLLGLILLWALTICVYITWLVVTL